uniref:DEFENSIN domain-containing protein n=1 Tax=Caenorhabditis tropicalis TaxID=1561998 RepID=A0A1I7U3L4_9PELO
MLTRVPILILAFVVVLALCQEPEKPEKRPALLSRYGRAVLPRYGKRSGNNMMMESGQSSVVDDSSDVVCQLMDGKYICLPVDAVRFRPFFV